MVHGNFLYVMSNGAVLGNERFGHHESDTSEVTNLIDNIGMIRPPAGVIEMNLLTTL